ncbi:MAG: DUF1501 domain-containing protein [Pseudomonadota bacterium]
MSRPLSRRAFLGRSALLGCSAAASPLITPVSLAAAPWDTRVVVIVLRGGMDGLDAVRPVGDPGFAALRPEAAGEARADLDLEGGFALHPALSELMPLWHDGDLGVVHAVSTPYRDKRSHFDGQDILEAGTQSLVPDRSGWLNRMLQHVPGVAAETAYAVGRGEMKVLMGQAPVADWTPDAALTLSPQALRLAELVMESDPAFHAALSEAIDLSHSGGELSGAGESMDSTMRAAARGAQHVKVADFVANRLRGETRVAAFSLNGWDTHAHQARNLGTALGRLSETLLALKTGTGPEVWSRTAVLAMTEFGRTARMNGTGGTDHGTGGAMFLAGGALRGGRVLGHWPGLAEVDLYDRRDLRPTGDVRAPVAWVLGMATGLDRATLEQMVFPGLDMGPNAGDLF